MRAEPADLLGPPPEAPPRVTYRALAALAGAAAAAAVGGSPADPVTAADVRRWEDDAWPTLRSELQAEDALDTFRAGAMTAARTAAVTERLIEAAGHETEAVTGLLNDGKITLGRWSARMRLVAGGTAAAAFVLALGAARVPDAARPLAARLIGRQFGFLGRFREAVRTGDQPLGEGAVARARLYADAAWSVGAGAEAHMAERAGATECRRILGASRHCFPPGTLVETAEGPIPIERVRRGQMVLTRAGYRPVVRTYLNHYEGDLVEVRAGSQTVRSTPNHPFLTSRGWVRADGLIGGYDAVLLKDSLDEVRLSVTFPDADDRISARGQVSIPSRVPALLGLLPLSQVREPRVTVPPVPVRFDHEPTGEEIDHEVRFHDDLGFVVDAERVKYPGEFGFEFRGVCLPQPGMAFEQGPGILGVFQAFTSPSSDSLASPRESRRIVLSHVLGGLVVNDSVICLCGQLQAESLGLDRDSSWWNAEPFGHPGHALMRVMFPHEFLHRIRPGGLIAADGVAAPTGGGIGILASPTVRADVQAVDPLRHDYSRLHPGSVTKHLDYSGPVYNLEIADVHEYFADGFLVHNCNDCPPLADLGWVPIDEMVPIGESACLVRCRCSVEYR